jgi:HSP20 family protein
MGDPHNVFGDIERARREMESIVRQAFGATLPILRPFECVWRPNVDVFEYGENIVIVAELAGVKHEDVSVVFDGGNITISGIRRDETPYRPRKYSQIEIHYDEFERVVHLPGDVDVDKIRAKLDNGIMIIEAPKRKKEPPKNYQVEIG